MTSAAWFILFAGDDVFGLAPGCLGPTVLVPASLVVPMPSNITYEAAATTPTVYTTVLIAFQNVRNMGPDTHLMVHAGTGGVGLAAIQVAGALGCRVSASASSPAKRLQLRRMGLSTISDSRTNSFTESLSMFQGQGFDVLLNSLTSPGKMGIDAYQCIPDTALTFFTRMLQVCRRRALPACL